LSAFLISHEQKRTIVVDPVSLIISLIIMILVGALAGWAAGQIVEGHDSGPLLSLELWGRSCFTGLCTSRRDFGCLSGAIVLFFIVTTQVLY
jgi:uncharacterized membrane protein YeaQ/YmgE (transglycosylase-associated protein family)